MKKRLYQWQIDATDKPGTVWVGAYNGEGLVGISAYRIIKNYVRYKVLLVDDEFHRQGIGTLLWNFRQELIERDIADKPHIAQFNAFCTPMSLGLFIKNGFTLQNERVKYWDNKEWWIGYVSKRRL